ncbi:MAG TPA: phosphoribosylaminoimidazolesuccinocarboxamide synthase [Candidatus Saccharimonadales bacterium]|nr:phosphoribosylaminoimidazolesuccinocarboxamide synthase [Candidatus Saccharimonadales bacterium]
MALDSSALPAVGEVDLPSIPLYRRGKVRDTFDLGDRLLMVSTDRISAFDSVLPTLIPDKGRVLTKMSRYWFGKTADLVPNHLRPDDPEALPPGAIKSIEGRAMFVAKAERIDVECVVRGRLAGSGWQEYSAVGTLAGEPVPSGLDFGGELPELRFTPATKNDHGHDENITRAQLGRLVGTELARRLEEFSIRIFRLAQVHCLESGFVLVDSKFEFGFIDGSLALIDELITPDSSRLWELGTPSGEAPYGFDKQPVRDYLIRSGWNRELPAPALPDDLVLETRRRYLEASRRITGQDL